MSTPCEVAGCGQPVEIEVRDTSGRALGMCRAHGRDVVVLDQLLAPISPPSVPHEARLGESKPAPNRDVIVVAGRRGNGRRRVVALTHHDDLRWVRNLG